jgi:hypothetical protein
MAPAEDRLDPAARPTAGRLGMNAAAFVLLAACPAGAQETSKAPEYRIKAAFLYNFTLYTEWPPTAFETPQSPIILAIAGEDPFGGELEAALRGKTVRGRTLEVRRYEQASDVAAPCHLLFLAGSQAKHLPQILKKFSNAMPLTVGETEDFTRIGGVIRLFVEGHKIRFEINTDAAHRAHLKLSSKLLHLAMIVHDPDAPKDR